MYSTTKVYYKKKVYEPSTITSTFNKPFDDSAKILIDDYRKRMRSSFNEDYLDFDGLKRDNPKYVDVPELIIISDLVDIVNVLYNNNDELLTQKEDLEELLQQKCNCNDRIGMSNLNLEQDTSIDLVYLQYLLLFDISETGGVFIESNLKIAQNVIDNNGGKLKVDV